MIKIISMHVKFFVLSLAFLVVMAFLSVPAHAVCSNNEDGVPGVAGEIEYFTTTGELYYCDDTEWVLMSNPVIPADSSTDVNFFVQFFQNAIDAFRAALANQFFAQTPGGSEYVANAVEFDGSTDYLVRAGDLTGNADSKLVTGSFWVKPDTASTQMYVFDNVGNDFRIARSLTNRFSFSANNPSGTNILNISTSNIYDAPEWYHVIFSFDMANPSNRHIYVNNVSDINIVGTYTDDVIDFTTTDHWIGVVENAGSSFLDGNIADLWIDFGTYIDLSVESNRRKFISEVGHPVDLGADGSMPTGSVPDIFLSGDTASWHTNKGTGGGFTENGALTDGANVAANGLVGHYKLDETTGTSAVDYSPNANNGTFSGETAVTSAPAIIETGYAFDGTDDVVTIPDSTDLTPGTGDFTTAFWFKADDVNSIEELLSKRQSALPFNQWSVVQGTITGGGTYNSSKKISLVLISSATTSVHYLFTTNDIVDGNWHHLVATREGANTPKIYVDGQDEPLSVALNMGTAPQDINNTEDWTIGHDNGIGFGKSTIDDVRIYNRYLSATEVTALYNLGNDSFSLVGHYKLDETSGTTATDSSPYGNDGTMTGGLDAANDSVDGVDETAFDFDGVDDEILTTLNPSGLTVFTASAWIKPTEFPSSTLSGEANIHNILCDDNGNTNATFCLRLGSLGLAANAQRLGIAVYDGTGDNDFKSTVDLSIDQWQHVTASYDGSNVRFYINGALDSTHPLSITLDDGSENFRIGNNPRSNESRFFEGGIDDVRIYNRVLTADEVMDLYNDVNSALVGHWKLDETTGTTAADSTPNGNDGTLTNANFSTNSVDGIIDNALSFEDGVGETISITNGTNFPTGTGAPTTISLWLKGDGGEFNNNDLFFYGGDESANNYFKMRIDNSGTILQGFFFGGNRTAPISPPLTDGEWRHITFVHDGTNINFYVDGILSSSSAVSIDFDAGNLTLNAPSGVFEVNAAYDDVRVYNRALTAAEVLELYNKPNEALVGHWKLDETTGTTAVDSSINGNDGTMQNGLDATNDNANGVFETALKFDGDNDSINLGQVNELVGSSQATMSFWFNANFLPTALNDNDGLVIQQDDFNNVFGCRFNGNSSGIICFVESATIASSVGTTYSSASIEENKWHHLAYTFDAGTSTIYIDGVQIGSPSANLSITTIPNLTNNMLIAGATGDFDGSIDDVRIYNRALSTAEVTDLYNNANEPLVAHYKLDETTGTTATDSSSYGNDGTMNGGVDTSTITRDGIIDTGFDMFNARVDISGGDEVNNIKNVTISGWVIPRLANTDNRIVTKNDAYQMELRTTTGEFTFKVEDGTSVSVTLPTPIEEKWYHLAGSFNADTDEVRYYLNGQLYGTVTNTEEFVINTDQIRLGDGGIRSPNALDDIRIYNTILSDAEVQDLYHNSLGGLVAHYRLDETSGTTAADSTPNGNDATMAGGLTGDNGRIDGPVGTGITFGGDPAHRINIPHQDYLNIDEEISVALWYLSRLDTGTHSILSKSSGNYQMEVVNDNLRFKSAGGSNSSEIAFDFAEGEWYHIVATFNDTTNLVTYYVDGVEIGTGTTTDTFTGTSGITLGANTGTKLRAADDLRIYNRVISAAEVLELYNAGDPPSGAADLNDGLIGYWPLDETSGTSAADSSGNGNDGVMQGSLNAGTDSTTGIIDNALSFNGTTTDFIDAGSDDSLDTEVITYAAWINPTTVLDAQGIMIAEHRLSSTTYNHAFGLQRTGLATPGAVQLHFYNGGFREIFCDRPLEENKWQHVAISFDSSSNIWACYYNGEQTSTGTNTFDFIIDTGNILRIGRSFSTGSNGEFSGELDDLRIYNRALSPAEIEILAACTGPGSYYYNFSDNVQQWCDGVASAHNMGAEVQLYDQCLGDSAFMTTAEMDYIDDTDARPHFVYCNSVNGAIIVGRGCTSCGGSATEKVAFTGSNQQTAVGAGTGSNFGGITGADASCQRIADTLGLNGTYYAWLADSDPNSAPATRFSTEIKSDTYAIVDTLGRTIANNWTDLTDGTIDRELNTTAYGVTVRQNNVIVPTNVTESGTQESVAASGHCNDWSTNVGTSNHGEHRYTVGTWTNENVDNCNRSVLYCFEQ